MHNLIDKDDFINAAQLKKYKASRLADVLMKTLKLKRVNAVYKKAYSENSLEFIDTALEQLAVQFHVNPDDLKHIPTEGAFVTISNHPYGGIDGLILIRIMSDHRSDFKAMANFLLQKIEPIKDHLIPVNPFDDRVSAKSSFGGMKEALKHLKGGHPLGIFPAGEVSTFHQNHVADKQWNSSTIRMIQHAGVPIVPVYFHGGNSAFFHILGFINPILRTAKLPSELLNKKKKVIEVRIGKPIDLKEQEQFPEPEVLARYLRSKTYALGSALEVKRFFRNELRRKQKPEPILAGLPQDEVVAEIETLRRDHWLFDSSSFSVFCAPSPMLPIALQEIGRLREITYRAVGEGTNHAFDLDEFDLYYQHLIIWDNKAQKIAGGYRVGRGKEIMRAYGIRGFYVHQLFKVKRKFSPILKESLELGRSYIVAEYQKKPLPLFLLWKGILVLLLKNPEYRYLLGPVSISSRFSGFSQGILIEFMKRHFYNEELACLIKPRKSFRIPNTKADVDLLLKSSSKDLAKLDKLIQDIEPTRLNIPVLFKKYIKQNAKVIGFNLDPKFNNALDGLMLLDIYDIPASTIQSLLKEVNDSDLELALKKRNLS